MGKLLNYCRGYAAKFNQNSPNLLFMGHTGLGKTHLALAIADAVLEGAATTYCTQAPPALAAQLGARALQLHDQRRGCAACQGGRPADFWTTVGTEYITPLTISVLV